jgi:glycosyltransferase involved in cell wall biosynthesis
MNRPPNPELIVFADDWGRHPSSAQHLVRHLTGRFAISWINTIGTRTPSLDIAVIRRGLGKVLDWADRSAPIPAASPSVRVLSPFMFPGFRTVWQRKLNAGLLTHFLRKQISDLKDAVIVSTIPIVADLPERVSARRWVYYCVDDFSTWPGLDSEPLREMERKFVRRADSIVVAGGNLAQRIRMLGRDSQVVSHGIELEHWRGPGTPTSLLDGFERPLILFWGLIDRRLHLEALGALNRVMTAGTIVLVGPQQDPDGALQALERVRLTGPSPYETLPALAKAADVLIMPYADLAVTRAMQPLKLREYLATGKPVVATRLPALAGWDGSMDIVDTPAQFASAVQHRAGHPLPDAQSAARQCLQRESWSRKAEEFANILLGD